MPNAVQHNALNGKKKKALKYLLLAGQGWYILRREYNIKKNLDKLTSKCELNVSGSSRILLL
jgi:hypothetical protein